MRKKIVLTGALITLFLSIMIALPVYAEPDNKVPFTISGYAIKAPANEIRTVGDGAIIISSSYEDTIMSLKFTLGTTVYYVKASVQSNIEFNMKTMQGNGLYKWKMEFYAKKLTVTIDNPIIGTLEGTTASKITARDPTGLITGTGMQVGSQGTGIMHGVITKCEGTYYPLALSGPLGILVTQGVSYEGTAILND